MDATLRAAPPVRRAATEGVPAFRRFHVPDKDASICGACWHHSLIHVECRPLLNSIKRVV
eukprot:15481712-Alexandrium_andersonii.AAC.1